MLAISLKNELWIKKEFVYLVKYAIDFFKRGSEINNEFIYYDYEDVAWDYARGVLENTLDEDKKQDLYSRLINKLKDNNEYKNLEITFSEQHEIKHSNNTVVNMLGEEEAILLFLMDWNYKRFTNIIGKSDNLYIGKFLQAIRTILSEKKDITNECYADAFKRVKECIFEKTETNEYVAPAKILMLLDPDKFIAWDTNIAKRFNLFHKDPFNYQIFNNLIKNFIERNSVVMEYIENYAKDYMMVRYYIDNDSHKIRKLLDMIFWIAYNTDYDSTDYDRESFANYTEKLVNSIFYLC